MSIKTVRDGVAGIALALSSIGFGSGCREQRPAEIDKTHECQKFRAAYVDALSHLTMEQLRTREWGETGEEFFEFAKRNGWKGEVPTAFRKPDESSSK